MDTKSTDLTLLATLDVLLAERNVTHAARRLGLSQPAVSAQLARLRDLFGDPLLLPDRRGMIPTARALAMQDDLHTALEGVRGVVARSAAFNPTTVKDTITIAASDYGHIAVSLPLEEVLRREAPGLRLAMRALDVPELFEQSERGDVDLAVSIPATAPERMRARRLFDERYVCIVRRNHPSVDRTLDLATFAALEHIVVSPRGGGFSGPTDAALAANGLVRHVVVSAASFLIVPEMVARSDRIALVPERLVRDRGDTLIRREPPLPVEGFAFGLVWHDRTTTSPLHRWVRDQVVALMG